MFEGTGEWNKEVVSSGGKIGELLGRDTSGLVIITEGCRSAVILLKDIAVGVTVIVLKTDEGVNDANEVEGLF